MYSVGSRRHDALALEVPLPVGAASAWVDLVGGRIQAGFPSPAEDLAAKRVDLNEVLIKHPQATYLMRVRGDSMVEAGIADGDTLVVDRAIKPLHSHVVVAVVDNEFTVKRLWKRGSKVVLEAANRTHPNIVPRDGQTIEIWGVVTNVIKHLRT